MRNASGQVKMSGSEKIKANMNTGNKIFGKHIGQFLHKKCVTRKFEVLVVQNSVVPVKNNCKERQKRVLHVQICFFAN